MVKLRKFRDREVIGWKTITKTNEEDFDKALNDLMDNYDMIDCQFAISLHTSDLESKYATDALLYSALVLLAEKTVPIKRFRMSPCHTSD